MLAFFAENPWLVRRRVGTEKKGKRKEKEANEERNKKVRRLYGE